LAARTPGEEGRWFAAAKPAGLYDQAIVLANRSPCDPRTLTRAARALGRTAEVREMIRELVSRETFGERFVTRVLGHELGLS
jgi:hypothetical protein